MEFLTTYRITEKNSKQRIDVFLSRRYGYLSRTEWQKEIQQGKITYNGETLTRNDKKISTGDLISYSGRDAAEPEVDISYSILYEDEHLLAVNKPGNLPVHPAGIFYHNTLLTILQKQHQKKLHLLHRLDRETSGVVVLAKDPGIASEIQRNYFSVAKTYLAMVHGIPDKDEFTVDLPIDLDTESGIEHKRIAREGARENACTKFIRIVSHNGLSILKAVPVTGRQHQIRVHLKHAGYPIVGDKLYGRDETVFHEFTRTGPTDAIVQRLGFRRSALHSRTLLLFHPVLKKKIFIKAPLQDDMRQLINQQWGINV